jgi:hypothetical protein
MRRKKKGLLGESAQHEMRRERERESSLLEGSVQEREREEEIARAHDDASRENTDFRRP